MIIAKSTDSTVSSIARLPQGEPPVLVVVVDTEEEFDWGADFDRAATSVEAMASIGRAQEVCDGFGVRPVYVIDYPVAAQEKGYRQVKGFVESGRAALGAHLHPWVNPPFEEEVSRPNSFAGNLPRRLEAEKLRRLTTRIEESFGSRPVVYKAGRYGLGENTAAILEEQGFEVDLSSCPPFDFRQEGGPDYSRATCRPFWFGARRRMLGLPTTGAYVGFLTDGAHRVYSAASRPAMRWARLPAILSRLGAVDRLRLSPEGFEMKDLRRLTEALLRRGVGVFSFSFHSPSLAPGRTPYVVTESELEGFLDKVRRYFDFFLGELGGVSMTPLEVKACLEGWESGRTASPRSALESSGAA